MKSLFLGLLLLVLMPLGSATIYTKLSNYGQGQLLPGDSLISTEGMFIATLQQTGCAMQVQRFVNNAYQVVGNYTPGSGIVSCNSLLINGSYSYLYTNIGQIYLALNQLCNISNFLIDDNGVFHLICIPNNAGGNGSQINITLFQTNQTFLQASSNAVIDTTSVLNPRTNLGGWTFQAQNGTFTMYNSGNSTQSTNYTYLTFYIFPAVLQDIFQSGPPRWVNFPETRFQPRCGYLNYFSFGSPYVFTMDPYWPILTVKDQTGYPILKLTYPMFNCVNDFGLLQTNQVNCVQWVCPTQLFQFNGSCVTACPPPYFHYIKRNASKCVLNCQDGATRDNNSRICTCGSYNAPACPSNSNTYPGGCICTTGFYDGIACLNSCPTGYLAMNGICANCPQMCATCALSTNAIKFSYLTCITCIPGHTLSGDKCILICNPLMAGSIQVDGTCLICSDPNCANCTTSSSCLRCTPFYLLQNGVCVLNCTAPTVLAYIQYNSFVCLTPPSSSCLNYTSVSFNKTAFLVCSSCPVGNYILGSQCVSNCPSTSSTLINDATNGVCRCPTGYIMINITCYQMATCPIKMSYFSNLGMCFSCPYGCLTCVPNSFPTICTSCTPGYVFFAYSLPYCGFNSPYYQCINGYTLVGDYSCIPNNPTAQYLGCISSIPNCQVCVYNNAQVCIACNLNFNLYNNTCLSSCPAGTFSGRGQCLASNPFAPNCLNNTYIKSISSYQLVNYNIVNSSAAYNYYTFNGLLPDNNPVGSILSNSLGADTTNRSTYVRDAGYYCPQCISGYASDFYGSCIPCPYPCATCVIADVNWCITCLNGTVLTNGRQCLVQDNNISGICLPGQFMNSSGVCVNTCLGFYLPQGIDGVNCTESCPINYFPTVNNYTNVSTTFWCNKTVTGYTGIQGVFSQAEIKGYDYLNFLPFQSAIYRQHNGQTLAYMIPFNSFYNYQNIVFPQYQVLGNESQVILQPPGWAAWIASLNSTGQLTYNATSGQYMMGNSPYNFSSLSPRSPYYNWFNITNSQYLLINTTGKPNLFLVSLANGSYPTMMSTRFTYPANFYLGMKYGSSRPQKVWHNFSAIGAIFSVILLLLHVLYIGNDYMYKVDNTLILAQTAFLFQFTWSVMPIQMAQFFWGWFFAHLGFIPNIFRRTIPSYFNENAPIEYKLVTQDANLIRNAGFAFTCLVFFLGVYLLVVLVTLMIRTICLKYQVWWPYILKNCLLAFCELLFMVIFYWSITEIRFGNKLPTSSPYFRSLSFGIAILFIVVILIYTALRFFWSLVGGIYCLKRITIALILAFSQNGQNWVCFLYAAQVIFLILRLVVEKPFMLADIGIMLGEQILIVAVYSVLIFGKMNFAATAIFFTLVICIFTVFLIFDLLRVYTDSRNEWDQFDSLYQRNNQVVIGSERVN